MEKQEFEITNEVLLDAYIDGKLNDCLSIVKQDQINEEIKFLDSLIDTRLFFITKFSERYTRTRSKDDFVALKESISRLAEFMIIREKCF